MLLGVQNGVRAGIDYQAVSAPQVRASSFKFGIQQGLVVMTGSLPTGGWRVVLLLQANLLKRVQLLLLVFCEM
jgi:hypothetical protein